MQQPNTLWTTVFFPYVSYVSLFLGMGLISGALVHMPVDPLLYTWIMISGIILFGFASFMSDIRQQPNLTPAGVVRALFLSLLLSVGIGMMTGGIQHFSDNPEWSVLMIPLGLGISLFSFILKQGVRLSVKRFYAVLLIFVMLAVPLKMGLTYMAETIVEDGGSGHGH